jgi:hypothetical protein
VRRLALAAVLLVAAGCGGSARLPELGLEPGGPAGDRGPGLVALRFVQAARAGDTERLRALMSAPTQASFGPGGGAELARQLAGFTDARIVLSRPLDGPWAVAALAGRDDDGDPAAWAAALRLEDEAWRVELGGVFFTRLRPAPLADADPRPEIRVEAQAGGEVDDVRAWIVPEELRARAVRRAPFTREIWGRLDVPLEEGLHTLVAFAVAGETAGAVAWQFEVGG